MPAARGVKRAASKASAATASSGPKNKKKRGAIQLELPTLPKRRGKVLTCGQGDVGQLGLGEDVIETTKFKHVSKLPDNIVDVCAGGMHTIALDSDGQVWTFGCNDEGALGRPTSSDTDEGSPARVLLPAAALRVSAGDSHSAALADTGAVYAWGSFRDSHGTMGLVVRGREGKACKEPVKIEIPEQAVDIASGGDHLAILTVSGSVYTMGCGEQGQLGRLSQRSASRDARQGFSALLAPTKVTLKTGASRIWAGYHATFAQDAASDRMFAWGLNNYGQLGISGAARRSAVFLPAECDAFSSRAAGAAGGGERGAWLAVAAGQHHCVALDAAGHVHCVGRCEYGRLGLGESAGDAETLEIVPALQNFTCISIAAGTSSSFAVTDTGEVYGWGMGSEGQLGTGRSADAAEPEPALLPALTGPAAPARVSAGGQHTVVLVAEHSGSSPSPSPAAAEPAVQPADSAAAPAAPAAAENKRGKRQKTQKEPTPTQPDPPAKPNVNGEQQKEEEATAMEVDETDSKSQDTQASETTDTEDKQNTETEDEMKSPDTDKDNKPDATDTSSQDTAASDAPADVDMEPAADTPADTPAPAPDTPAEPPAAPDTTETSTPTLAPVPAAETKTQEVKETTQVPEVKENGDEKTETRSEVESAA